MTPFMLDLVAVAALVFGSVAVFRSVAYKFTS
jgi:hypothetical protein